MVKLLPTLQQKPSEQANEGVTDMSEWQPIETAKKSGEWILGFGDGESTQLCPYIMSFQVSAWTEIYSGILLAPTHWMPLPEPPKP